MPVPLRTTFQKAEAKYNVTTDFPNYHLHAGAANGDIGLVDYALAQGQPVNSVLDGVLPLHAAAAGGNEQVVLRLIEHGADVNAPRLPRRYSNEKGRDTSAPIVGDSGATPLHFAAANGNTEIVRILLQRGAHPDRADKHGVTPEHLARRDGWLECADFLKDWARNKDRDLIEREGRIPAYRPSLDDGGPSRSDVQEGPSSGRKRLHVKKSIDTAFHMLKGSASDAHLRLHTLKPSSSRSNIQVGTSFHTPPASPTRSFGEYTFYPVSPTEESSSDPADPSHRRPSLPHVLNPPAGVRNPSLPAIHPHHSTASPSPGRPGSADTDADRTDTASSPPVPRRLGSKYSLMNLFKKGQAPCSDESTSNPRPSVSSTAAVPLSGSTHSSPSNLSPSPSAHLQLLPSAPNDPSVSPSSNRSHLNSRYANTTPPSNPISMPGRTRAVSSTKSQSPPLQHFHQVYRHSGPSAVELHNTMAQQQYGAQQTSSSSPVQNPLDHPRERLTSTAGGSRYDLPPPLPVDNLLQLRSDGSSIPASSAAQYTTKLGSSPPSGTSPLGRIGVLSRAGITSLKSRSGGSNSPSGSRDRSGAVFDEDLVVPVIEPAPSKSSQRPPGPGILRGHSRTPSGNSSGGNRALRFNSGLLSRPEEATFVPPQDERSLRGSNSLSSFSRDNPSDSNSAPAAVSDFAEVSAAGHEDYEVDDDYGQPLANFSLQPPSVDTQAVETTAIPARVRGFSFTSSSESSFSPIDGDTCQEPLPSVHNDGPTITSEFPFSINQPPPTSFNDGIDGRVLAGTEAGVHLRVPSADDEEANRSRGDSVSSASTDISSQGALTTSTSDTLGPVAEPVVYVEEVDVLESTVKAPTNVALTQKETPPASLGHRRTRTPMDINISSISTHAQAEALVQRAQQDILEMENELLQSGGLSTGSAGWTPLSAKLAKYGESLALERRLRERKEKDGDSGSSPPVSNLSAPSATHTPSDTSAAGHSYAVGVHRQLSLEHRTKESRPRTKQFQPRRPHTSSGTPEARNSFAAERGKTHQSSHSASIVDIRPTPVVDIRPRAFSIDAELESPTTPLVERARSNSSAYPSSSTAFTSPEADNVESPPFTGPTLYSEDLSRTTSLEVNDTDREGYSVHTPYSSVSSRTHPREVARATKLVKMGFDAAAARQPTPTRRFGGIKSLIQGLKGK